MTIAAGAASVLRERVASNPLLDLQLIMRPLVASGPAYKAASGLSVAGLSSMATLQLQFAWGWPPGLAAVALLPQVVVLLAGGRFAGPVLQRLGSTRAAWMSAAAVVAGLAVFAGGSPYGYVWVLIALVDTASELANGVGIAATGTILAAFVSGSITTTAWTPLRLAQFQEAITTAGIALTVVAAALVTFGIIRSRPIATTDAVSALE